MAYLLGRSAQLDSNKKAILLLGTIMPDFERVFPLLCNALRAYRAEEFFYKMLTQPFHSLLGLGMLTVFFASFFPEEPYRRTFLLLIIGGIMHLLLDMMMWPWSGGYTLFFPLQGSKYTYSFRLIWPGNMILPTLIGFPTALLLIYDRRNEKKRKEIPKGANSLRLPSAELKDS